MTVSPLNGVALHCWRVTDTCKFTITDSPYLFSSFLSPLSQEQDPPYSSSFMILSEGGGDENWLDVSSPLRGEGGVALPTLCLISWRILLVCSFCLSLISLSCSSILPAFHYCLARPRCHPPRRCWDVPSAWWSALASCHPHISLNFYLHVHSSVLLAFHNTY